MENFGQLFESTLLQMLFLFAFILVGFILRKTNTLKESSIGVMSKMVSSFFLPLVLVKSFMNGFTRENLSECVTVLIFGVIVALVTVFVGLPIGALIVKDDDYKKKIYQYGLIFSNFSYVGIPLIEAVFPAYSNLYVIFTVGSQFVFTLWALPNLLIPHDGEAQEKATFKSYAKRLLNPIFLGLLLGAILGITGLTPHIPETVTNFISTGASCMSPVTMLLTGVVVANYDMKKVLKDVKIYILSGFRLVLIPVALGFACFGIMKLFGIENPSFMPMLIIYLAMPLGLNSVIIPAAYGKDPVDGAGMALISSVLGLITIPLVVGFMTVL